MNYYQSVSNRTFGASPAANADFDLAYDYITTFDQGSMGGAYTVRAGDTLSSIAAGLWGDASLWWKIAEANGLTGQSTLTEGAQLLIPVGVQRNENNAETFKPYDPLEVLGNTSPTSPKPAKGNNCGVIGTIILVVIAIIVTIYTAGAAAGGFAAMMNGGSFIAGAGAGLGATATGASLTGAALAGAGTVGAVGTVAAGAVAAGIGTAVVAGGIVGGAVGSIVSQGVGVATGIQDEFSWNAVALAAIGGGVGGGMGWAAQNGSAVVQAALSNPFVYGAASSAITQGIGVATGLQDKFSWAGVAAAGVGAYVGAKFRGDGVGDKLVRNTASAMANAATRSLIDGSDFGDNMLAALPDVIGQTIGEAIAGGISRRTEEARAEREWEERVRKWEGTVDDSDFAQLPMDEALTLYGAKLTLARNTGTTTGTRTQVRPGEAAQGYSSEPMLDPLTPEEVDAIAGRRVVRTELGSEPGTVIEVYEDQWGRTGSRVRRIEGGRDLGETYFTNPGSSGGGPLDWTPPWINTESALTRTLDPHLQSIADFYAEQGWGEMEIDSMLRNIEESYRVESAPAELRAALQDVSVSGGASRPNWFQRMLEGIRFDRAQAPTYPHNQVYVESSSGGHFVVDSYDPIRGEIISRKHTQLASISLDTARAYISEASTKYAPGRIIADVQTNRDRRPGLIGEPLRGQVYLEVPVQTRPVPQPILSAARNADIIIRDINGRVWR